MKKVLVLFLVLMLVLSGCASEGVAQAEYDALQEEYEALQAEYDALKTEHEELINECAEMFALFDGEQTEETGAPQSGDFVESEVLEQLKVTEYSYKNEWSYYHFFEVENESEFDLEISIAVKFYNEAGELVGAQGDDECAFGKGQKILFYFMPDEAYSKTEYEISVAEETYFSCAVPDLSYESVPALEKEIVSVTNNGEDAADFVECSALFFKGDEAVHFDFVYFIDDDDELKPGKTITKEISCYEEYDSVVFYFTGRR